MKKKFIISVDVEGIPLRNGDMDYSSIIIGVPLLLDLFNEYNVRSTFFVTSDAAENTAGVLREVIRHKHEIGHHGYEHQHFYLQKPNKHYVSIKEATKKISDYLKVIPIGFRAHLFKVNEEILKSLIKLGYKYDSSIISSSKMLNKHSSTKAPKTPYHLILHNMCKKRQLAIIEIPISILPIIKLPLGLSYIKFFGSSFSKFFLLMINQKVTTLYLHPYDLFSLPDEANVPFYFRLAHKKGRGFSILRGLLEYFEETFSPTYICAKEVLYHTELVTVGVESQARKTWKGNLFRF